MTEHEKQVENLVDRLQCSIFEAEQVLADDKKIDRNETVNFGLTKEEEKQALKYANVTTHRKPMVLNFAKKEKAPDTTKEGVIKQVYDFLVSNGYEGVEITNKSKLIAFKIGEDNFEFNLIRKRKKK